MNTNTPETDAETMDGSFKEQGCTITLRQWDYYKSPDGDVVMADFARRLERERDEALAKLSAVFQWINRNHPDGFIDSLTHLQNLERVSDVQHDRFDRLERERDLAHDQLSRICKEGFGNQDTIGLEPADDYVLRKLADAEAELSVSNGERDHYRRENAEMREAINEVSKRLQSIQLNDIFEETMRYNAALALAKLKPFLK